MADEPVRPEVLEVGERVRTLRERHGMSVRELGRRADVGGATVSRLEAGLRMPQSTALRRIITALESTSDHVLDGKPEAGGAPRAPEAEGRDAFLQVYRGDELTEAKRYLDEEGERAMRMAGVWSPADFRDHYVSGFKQWRAVQASGAETPLAVARVHDSRATPLQKDPKKGPRRAER